jgi:hypothetical protein
MEKLKLEQDVTGEGEEASTKKKDVARLLKVINCIRVVGHKFINWNSNLKAVWRGLGGGYGNVPFFSEFLEITVLFMVVDPDPHWIWIK